MYGMPISQDNHQDSLQDPHTSILVSKAPRFAQRQTL